MVFGQENLAINQQKYSDVQKKIEINQEKYGDFTRTHGDFIASETWDETNKRW